MACHTIARSATETLEAEDIDLDDRFITEAELDVDEKMEKVDK